MHSLVRPFIGRTMAPSSPSTAVCLFRNNAYRAPHLPHSIRPCAPRPSHAGAPAAHRHSTHGRRWLSARAAGSESAGGGGAHVTHSTASRARNSASSPSSSACALVRFRFATSHSLTSMIIFLLGVELGESFPSKNKSRSCLNVSKARICPSLSFMAGPHSMQPSECCFLFPE
jgi:hypothetical protein